MDELQDVVTQIEAEKASLLKKLSARDRQVELYRDQLTSTQEQMSKLQKRLDKVRF